MSQDARQLPSSFQSISQAFTRHLAPVHSPVDGMRIRTMQQQLDDLLAMDLDAAMRQRTNAIQQALKRYFNGCDADADANHAQVIVSADTSTCMYTLTLIPPRKGGRMYSTGEIHTIIRQSGVAEHLNWAVVDQAIFTFLTTREVIHCLPVGLHRPIHDAPRVQLHRGVLDKRVLWRSGRPNLRHIQACSIFQPRDEIGRITWSADKRDPDALPFGLGPGVALSADHGAIVSLSHGAAVMDAKRLQLLPLHVMHTFPTPAKKDIYFPGSLIVHADIREAITLHARDVFVLGHLQHASILASGDITITGNITGGNQTHIRCAGDFHAKHIAHAVIDALGDIRIAGWSIQSHLRALGNIWLPHGSMIGGTASAGGGIYAHRTSSPFGTTTTIASGEATACQQFLEYHYQARETLAKRSFRFRDLKTALLGAHKDVKALSYTEQDVFLCRQILMEKNNHLLSCLVHTPQDIRQVDTSTPQSASGNMHTASEIREKGGQAS